MKLPIQAEKRPSQRERLACFNYAVLICNNSNEVIEQVCTIEPNAFARRRDLSCKRVHVHKGGLVLTKTLADAILIAMITESKPVENPNASSTYGDAKQCNTCHAE